jgi:membrane dipeptidase
MMTTPPSSSSEQPSAEKTDLLQYARAIHERVLTLDSHIDFAPADLISERNYTQRLDTQFNLPKMIEGGLDGLFFIVFVAQTRESQNTEALKASGFERAYHRALEKFDAVHHFTHAIARDQIELAFTASDARRIHAAGKKIAFMGVENGYALGEDLRFVQEFYDRGARYLSLTHNGHNQLADSHTGEREGWKWHGVSPLGEEVVAAMNRLGMMVDVSHASKNAMMQIATLSKAPVIASHSAVRALCDVSRNLDDEQLLALQKTGGVIQVVAYNGFIKTTKADSPERLSALAALRKEYDMPETNGPGQRARLLSALKELPDARRHQLENRLAEIDKQYPGDMPATVKDFVDHIDYAVNLLGIDHVGISSDFDGGGGLIGWDDASETFAVTLELVRRGYNEEQIAKLWSGNLLRVMEEVQRIADQLKQ